MAITNDAFLKACRMQPTEFTPVWFMRQAGRYLPEYRALRSKYDLLTLATTPELAAEVSLQPVRALGVDAAILFADIMLVPIGMGIDVKIVDSVGPVIDRPIVSEADLSRLSPLNQNSLDFIASTIKILKSELTIPLIGFAGAPFTLASYLIQGAPSRDWLKTKRFMYEHPRTWHGLMDKLTTATIFHLNLQAKAGADALQLFDSWVGALSPSDFRHYVLPYNQRIMDEVGRSALPRIIFGTDTAGILEDFSSVGAEVVGLDWRHDLSKVRQLLPDKALQGNLDPAVLGAGWAVTQSKTAEMLKAMPDRTGYIFNLGHGVWKETNPDILRRLVDYVHEN